MLSDGLMADFDYWQMRGLTALYFHLSALPCMRLGRRLPWVYSHIMGRALRGQINVHPFF